MRINRFLARAGVGSRRGVEALVRDGRVTVNGERVGDLGRRVDPDHDEVRVDGRSVRPATSTRVLVLHKPVGVVSSLRRQGDAPCLLDVLEPSLATSGLFHVGRLDRESSGVLLLTDAGDLSQALLHPSRPVWKVYRVRTVQPVDPTTIDRWRHGGTRLDGRPLAPIRVGADPGDPRRLRLELREGRNRQIRRMVEAAGTRVDTLHRVAFGPVELGDLPPGALRPVTPEEDAALRSIRAAHGRD